MDMKKRSPYSLLLVAFSIILGLIITGTWFFRISEGWSIVDAFYFTAMTITTVGYGDLVPTHDVSKIITAIYGMISVPLAVFAFGTIIEGYMESRIDRLEKRMQVILAREEKIESELAEKVEVVRGPSLIKRIFGLK
jgi:hypothetical protein